MRHWTTSIVVHMVILCLLYLGIRLKSEVQLDSTPQQVVYVDFSEKTTAKANSTNTPRTKSSNKQVQNKAQVSPSPTKTKTKSKPKPKVNTSEPKAVTKESSSAELQQQIAEEKAALLAAQQKREKEQKEKISFFKKLLDNSQLQEGSPGAEESQELSPSNSTPSTTNDNIQGAISSRQVLKVPTISDQSQEQGIVVVKICVNRDGDVISSGYTQAGSTTTSAHLIGLAEEGAKAYKFSAADIERQCGRVIIDFRLRA